MRRFLKKAESVKLEREKRKRRSAVVRKQRKRDNEKRISNFLRTKDGKSQLDKISRSEILSTKYALDYETLHSKYQQFVEWLSDANEN